MPPPLLLLVDDSSDMGLIVASLGRRAGWEVTTRPDAETAWDALGERRPDLVLLDVNLPGANGLDWLRRVRRTPAFADLPVALYTHWGLPADVAAGLEAGVDFVFDKDLATRPPDWQRRLEEIRHAGQNAQPLGPWPEGGSRPTMMDDGPRVTPKRWAAAVRQALRQPALRRAAGEVLAALLRRGLTQAFTPRILPPEWDAWVASDGRDPERLPPTFAPASPMRLAVCLAEQIRRLLGAQAGRAFLDALAAALTGGEEQQSRP